LNNCDFGRSHIKLTIISHFFFFIHRLQLGFEYETIHSPLSSLATQVRPQGVVISHLKKKIGFVVIF